MLWRDVATLVKVDSTQDADGYKVESGSRREVFVDVQAVKRGEFYAAKQTGTSIAIAFLVRAADYENETRIEYKHPGDASATPYDVVRSYTKAGEILELNCSLATVPASVSRKGASI